MKIKFLVCLLALIMLFSSVGCNGTPSTNGSENSESVGEIVDRTGYSISDYTEYVYSLGPITGPNSKNYFENCDVGGTDLGFPVYDDTRDRMYFCFGDTFSNHMSGNKRGSTIGYVDNWTTAKFEDTLQFTGWLTDENGMAFAVADSEYTGSNARYETSKIPTGGICINGTFYIFLMSVRYWGAGGVWYVSFNGAVKSTDGGATWQRVFDLTWFESDSELNAELYKTLAEQEVDLTDGGVDLNVSDRVAPNFMQIAPVDGKDGYIYLFGCIGGRLGGLEMARVKKENFETFAEYEYFTGYDAKGNPTYVKGTEGLKIVRDNDIKTSNNLVVKARMGETTVFYNPYFEKWMMTDNIDNKIYMSMSKNIYGPYSAKQCIFDTTYDQGRDDAFYELYAGFSHELLLKNDGQSMHMVVSYMDKIYNSYLLEVKFN